MISVKKFIMACVAVLAVFIMSPFIAMAASVSPEDIKGWLSLTAVPFMWIIGAIYTRLPALKRFTNNAIPWINLVAFVFATYLVPAANAGPWDAVVPTLSLFWRITIGAATSSFASVLYDKFIKPTLDAAVPKP